MWVCPKCSRENGNSFNSCKSCGYVISEDEKFQAIEKTRRQLSDFNRNRSSHKGAVGYSGYSGPKLEYDEDDSYIEDIYTDDMFDDDDVVKKSHKSFWVTLIVILVLLLGGGATVYYLDLNGYISINFFSQNDYTFSEDSGGITITGYNGSLSTLEIPDVINGNIVTAIGDNAFEDSNIKSITLPETLKKIGSRAFFNCQSLHVVNISESITNIGSYAFASCPGLGDTFVPESAVEIGENVFKDSGNLYVKAVPGSKAMEYALANDMNYTPTKSDGNQMNVTPIRSGSQQTLTTSQSGYGAGCVFSFTPYETSSYEIYVEASIKGYLTIDEFGTMGKAKSEQVTNGKNHRTTLTVNLKKEKKYYFAIVNEGTEENKNIQFALNVDAVSDEQTKAEKEAKKWMGKVHSFTAYVDLFYDEHNNSGTSHYLEWNTNKQKIVDYYVEDDGTLWVAIYSPLDDSSETKWWYRVEE